MKIIEHRGGWYNISKNKNSYEAFNNSLIRHNGIETDIRDFNGQLVISHDVPNSSSMLFDNFLKLYTDHNSCGCLALNIKSDGLQSAVSNLLTKHNVSNYFFFDMSIPDTIGYLDNKLTTFIRTSEHELNIKEASPYIYNLAQGVWFDSFNKPVSLNIDALNTFIKDEKEICFVSPELHSYGLDIGESSQPFYLSYWRELKEFETNNKSVTMYLCTDFPETATTFFK